MFLAGKKIHFMGAGGIGVSALAEMAANNGATVTACDRGKNEMTAMLEHDGITVYPGHDPDHVAHADLLVYTSAVSADHPERKAAKQSVRRGNFLAQFMNRAESWGVAGTHGKTTTSWLLAAIALRAGLDPTVFIGGAVPGLDGRNFRLGTGPFVAELDESDGTFLAPILKVAVITNIESDHLSHYGSDAALFAAFAEFAHGVGKDGVLIAGADSPVSYGIYQRHTGRKISFGLCENADMQARNIEFRQGGGMLFTGVLRGRDLGVFSIRLTGMHNVKNALAALAAALEGGISVEDARTALAEADGVGRRMERLGEYEGALVYSDYAHHPTEVDAAVSAFRSMHPGKTLVVFQPHLYTRTRDYADAFAQALSRADMVLLVDIYPAREEPIPGITSDMLRERLERLLKKGDPGNIHAEKIYGPVPVAEAAAEAGRLANGCEAVIMMGAGDIDGAARKLVGLS